MGMWGGASAGGWSQGGPPSGRPSHGLKRSVDGWDDEELGRVYDHAVVRRLFPYLAPYKRQVVFAVLGMLLFAVASGAGPFLIGRAIDDFIPSGDLNGVALIGGVLVALAVIGWLA